MLNQHSIREAVRRAVAAAHAPSRVIVFGSYARSDADEGSDGLDSHRARDAKQRRVMDEAEQETLQAELQELDDAALEQRMNNVQVQIDKVGRDLEEFERAVLPANIGEAGTQTYLDEMERRRQELRDEVGRLQQERAKIEEEMVRRETPPPPPDSELRRERWGP